MAEPPRTSLPFAADAEDLSHNAHLQSEGDLSTPTCIYGEDFAFDAHRSRKRRRKVRALIPHFIIFNTKFIIFN